MSLRREPEPQTIDDVRDWHEAMTESVLAHRATVFSLFHTQSLPNDSRFFGLTYDEIDGFFVEQREELEALSVLSMMASAEATLRIDYTDRVRRGRSDALSKAYLAYDNKLPPTDRPALDEGIVG